METNLSNWNENVRNMKDIAQGEKHDIKREEWKKKDSVTLKRIEYRWLAGYW